MGQSSESKWAAPRPAAESKTAAPRPETAESRTAAPRPKAAESKGAAGRSGASVRGGSFVRRIRAAAGRVKFFEIGVSCAGIWAAYLLGMHVSGHFHASSRWMGAMLACTSVVVVLQKGSYRESLKAGVTRVLGTLIGAAVAYVYLRLRSFSVAGMLGMTALLEMVLMLLGMYSNSQMAVITMLIIMLVSKQSPDIDPAVNALLRFFESAVGSGAGIVLLWSIERWNAWRQSRRNRRNHCNRRGHL